MHKIPFPGIGMRTDRWCSLIKKERSCMKSFFARFFCYDTNLSNSVVALVKLEVDSSMYQYPCQYE